jgi:hypothetical protein
VLQPESRNPKTFYSNRYLAMGCEGKPQSFVLTIAEEIHLG